MSKPVDTVNHNAEVPGEEIAEEIHAIRHLFKTRRYRGQRAGDHELSHMEARVLYFLGRNPGATQIEVVGHFARDKAQVARLIAVLRKAGLLEIKVDDIDRRLKRLFLSIRGAEVHGEVKAERKRLAQRAVEGFGAAERKQLLTLLSRIRSNLEAS